MSDYLEMDGSAALIGGMGQSWVADGRAFIEGVRAFQQKVTDPNCFGDDELGAELKKNYPKAADIDSNCSLQKGIGEGTESLGQGLGQATELLDEIVRKGARTIEDIR